MILSQLNTEIQSDKGTHHSYIEMYYEKTLANYKDKTITLLEIGVNAGRSLELWAKYFNEDSIIIGIDKKMTVPYKPSKKNMRYIIGDATKEETVKKLDDIDIIIDDGSHRIQDQLKSFNLLYPKLKEDGVYIIEDIRDIDSTIQQFKDLENSHRVTVKIFDFRNLKNIKDDVIVEIRK
jgi:hypothetical protein